MLVLLLTAAAASAQSAINVNGGPLSLTFTGEVGLVKVLSHTITIGDTAEGNTTFNYVNTGGQEILFPISRLTAELGIGNRHAVILLYQPLLVETQVRLDKEETTGFLFRQMKESTLPTVFRSKPHTSLKDRFLTDHSARVSNRCRVWRSFSISADLAEARAEPAGTPESSRFSHAMVSPKPPSQRCQPRLERV